MARILVVNSYSFRDLKVEVDAGRAPNHLLYGVDYFAKFGHEIIDISGPQSRRLADIDKRLRRLPLPLGSIDHQVRILERLSEADVVYSPGDLRTHLLYLGRATGLLRVPIVSIAHHPLNRGRAQGARRFWLQAMLKGAEPSSIATLSEAVASEINTMASAKVAVHLPWGPDPAFYPKAEYPGSGVVAIGRTGRDYVTFARAGRLAGTPLTIVSWAEYLEPIRNELEAPNIKVVSIHEMLPHSELALLFARARAIAVPLVAGDSLSGLTGIMDAFGAGKPLLVTRKPTLDIDPVELGIGYAIDVGDVDGWTRALMAVNSDPDRATEMGRRARMFVDKGMDSGHFAAGIDRIIRRVVGEGS